jgi:GNAT superfamily N-acetyltransferase
MHDRCSLETRQQRYDTPRRSLTGKEWAQLVHPTRGFTWIATLVENPRTAIGLGHLLKTRTPGTYEVATLVEDAWQNHGIGTHLSRHALDTAAAHHATAVTATIGGTNRRARAICARLNARFSNPSHGIVDVHLPVPTGGRP